MVIDKDDPDLLKRIKWPIARVESFDRDSDGLIQTVTIQYKNNITRRGIQSLALLAGVEFLSPEEIWFWSSSVSILLRLANYFKD